MTLWMKTQPHKGTHAPSAKCDSRTVTVDDPADGTALGVHVFLLETNLGTEFLASENPLWFHGYRIKNEKTGRFSEFRLSEPEATREVPLSK